MAQKVSFQGLREQIVHSLYGRILGLDKDHFLIGKDIRVQTGEGFTTQTSTNYGQIYAVSTASTGFSNFGVSVVGTTSSASSTGSPVPLDAPTPGVLKTIYNPTTGSGAITTTGGNGGPSYICSTGSVNSTYQYAILTGKGSAVQLLGLTTALWAVMGAPNGMTTVSTNVAFI